MNKKDVCATKIAYVRFTEDDLADLDIPITIWSKRESSVTRASLSM